MGKKSRMKKGKIAEHAGRGKVQFVAGYLPAWIWVLVALIAILGVIRTIPYEFLYDDQIQILQNPWIQDWSKVGRFFTSDVWAFTGAQTRSNYYRPLQMVVYAAAYSIAGFKPESFHIFNILLHALCTVLVAFIGFRLSGNRWVALAAGLLFALHPVHAESVAWIAGITDPLCAFFYFAALYFYFRHRHEPENRRALMLSLGSFLGALFAKEMAFTLPIILVWLDWCLDKKLRWSRYALFAGVFALYSVMRVAALHVFSVQQLPMALSFHVRLLSTIVLAAAYLSKMFVPYNINAFHVFVPTTQILSSGFVTSVSGLTAFAIAAWLLRGQRMLLFVLGYCAITIAPVLNVTGIGESVFADRYLYIPTLGSCLLMPLAVQSLARFRAWLPGGLEIKMAGASLGVVATVFGWMLWHEVAAWRDTPTLYLETIRHSPGAAPIAHNLAAYYYSREDIAAAEKWDLEALKGWEQSFIKNHGELAKIYSGLGGVRFKQGRLEEARSFFANAYNEAPNDSRILENIAIFYVGIKDYQKAMSFFQATVKANPYSALAYSNMAGISAMYGQYDQGIAYAKKALEVRPDYGDAYVNLAQIYAAKGMRQEARQAYLELKRIDPSRADVADAGLKSLEEMRR